MKPLRITIKLSSPLIEPANLFHLDGLLAALRVKADEHADQEGFNPRDCQDDLPVERYVSPSGQWVFKASAFTLQRESEPRSWMMTGGLNTTTAAEHRHSGVLNLRSSKPNPAGGHFKGSVFYKPIIWGVLQAWCVGDKAGVEKLLSTCRQVGGKRGTGFGQVESIDVDEVAPADCRWYERALPSDFDGASSDELVGAISALRSPYWDRTLHQSVLIPFHLVGW
ncbi:hypothetical protein [Stutzerimonas nitrititolerans]|uniref:hypothetical protein n=1 Tax=Stutzerimonas nitrititolerans TaxID=2482751 RepID=UPI0028AAB139|nr:hypothetical protein [Stutzerimonas nitrititolerans]